MASVTATVQIGIAADQKAVFNHIAPIDLTTIFTGYGPLPAVTGVQDQTGPWDRVGRSRTVRLSDGSTARESITEFEPPSKFGYTVSDFSGALGLITTSAKGKWRFDSDSSAGPIQIKWSYTFQARSWLTTPLLWLVARFLWRGYMDKALRRCKALMK